MLRRFCLTFQLDQGTAIMRLCAEHPVEGNARGALEAYVEQRRAHRLDVISRDALAAALARLEARRRLVSTSWVWYNRFVERVGPVFASFDAADEADDQFYADLTPHERLDLLLELVERHRSALGASAERLERVHRIVELSQS
jgi:hypothetical protein